MILSGNSFQTFTVRPTRTDGFNELALGMHGSAFEQQIYVYRFSNGRYSRGPCFDAKWQKLLGDELEDLKDPIIMPCKTGR